MRDLEERYCALFHTGLHQHGIELFDGARDLRQRCRAQNCVQLLHASVDRGRRLELQIFRGLLALLRQFTLQGLPAALQKVMHPRHLAAVLIVAAALKAGRQAHFHLGIHAAGKAGIRIQIEIAAPQQSLAALDYAHAAS